MSTTVCSVGLCYASICTDDTDQAALSHVNLAHPTGVGEWAIADEPFADGSPNPLPCPDFAGHRHILVAC